jgi:hypothetical protein
MGFTSSQFYWIKERITEVGLFAVILVWEHIMLLIKYVMTTSISSLPKTVRDALKREQYELNKQRNSLMQERRQQQQQLLNEEMMKGSNPCLATCTDGNSVSHRQLSARLLKRRRSRPNSNGTNQSGASSSSVTTTTSNNRSVPQSPHVTFQNVRQLQRNSTSLETPQTIITGNPATNSRDTDSTGTTPESSYLGHPYLSEA